MHVYTNIGEWILFIWLPIKPLSHTQHIHYILYETQDYTEVRRADSEVLHILSLGEFHTSCRYFPIKT